jgi:hypothetical protein
LRRALRIKLLTIQKSLRIASLLLSLRGRNDACVFCLHLLLSLRGRNDAWVCWRLLTIKLLNQ